mgnify:FL=1
MQKVNLVCVGKLKEKFFADAVAEYVKRLGAFCAFRIAELPEKRTLAEEALLILREVRGYAVVLAVEGRKMSSEQLAARMGQLCAEGKEITFVIGSSCGLDKSVKDRADLLLSFSDMTFPHQLMRVIACEQIYRAFMIGAGREYHK